jgi:hypothetical protein
MTRHLWTEDHGPSLAVRLKARNTGATPIHLEALFPLRCEGPDGLRVGGKTAGGWDVLAQARFKNGVPTALRPGCFDDDYAQAVSLMGEMGEAPPGADGKTVVFEMDCFGLVRPCGDPAGPVLLLGFLDQLGCLARFRVKTDASRRDLEFLEAECEMDGCLVPVGGERTSPWVLMNVGADPDVLVRDFSDRVGTHHGVRPQTPPPSVYCSWQFYGPTFSEKDMAENLDSLAREPMPVDVFLIDECWDTAWGDWTPNERWPSGMKAAADRIRDAGFTPGIWTCPFLVAPYSRLAQDRPEWLLRFDDGTLHHFRMDGVHHVLDPTYPGVADFLEDLYRRLTHDWGFAYHKLDFLRAVFMTRRIRFHDPTVTRLEAYRRGLEAVRRGLGPDAYLSVCGGHYGGSIGLADSQRSGSDVAALWNQEVPPLPRIKQNLLRTWMSRLWHVDPDAMMVRRREQPFRGGRHGFLSLGRFTDDEARTIAVNQYLGGGLVCFSERLAELDADRRGLYRHVIPSICSPSVPLDPFEPGCPSTLLTRVSPRCPDLTPWATVAVMNWADEPRERDLALSVPVVEAMPAEHYLLCEFFEPRCLGLFRPGQRVQLGVIPAHGCRVVHIAPWDGRGPVLAGTDLHLSGGGVELAEWRPDGKGVAGRIQTRWRCPVRVTAAFPKGKGFALASTRVRAGGGTFRIARP